MTHLERFNKLFGKRSQIFVYSHREHPDTQQLINLSREMERIRYVGSRTYGTSVARRPMVGGVHLGAVGYHNLVN